MGPAIIDHSFNLIFSKKNQQFSSTFKYHLGSVWFANLENENEWRRQLLEDLFVYGFSRGKQKKIEKIFFFIRLKRKMLSRFKRKLFSSLNMKKI